MIEAFFFLASLKFLRSLFCFQMNNSPNQNISELPIAIFDSGIGGLSVLREAIHLLPNENYIYFADKENVPYGTKTKDEVNFWVLKAADFLNSQKIKMLVVEIGRAHV